MSRTQVPRCSFCVPPLQLPPLLVLVLLPPLEPIFCALLLPRKSLPLLVEVRLLVRLDLRTECLRARMLLVRGLHRLVVPRCEELCLCGLEGLRRAGARQTIGSAPY